MPDVVFIKPNLSNTFRDIPMGTLILSTILKNAGITSELLDILYPVEPLDEFLRAEEELIVSTGARIISFYTRCDVYHLEIAIAQRLKQRHPELYIVFGGPQSDLCAQATLEELDCVDYICCGEGELTIVPLFRSLLEGKPDETVDGLAFKRDGKIIMNPRPPMLQNLDEQPMIDFSAMNVAKLYAETDPAATYFPVDVGRGCPFSCTYCSTKTFWKQNYRLKSAARIIEDIKEMHRKFDVVKFRFTHDMLTLNKAKVMEICRMICDLDFKIKWMCSARVDCIDEEMVDAMIRAGMYQLHMGIETGSARMQKLVRKNLKLEKVAPTVKMVCDKGVSVIASFIYGFPLETEEDISDTIALIAEIAQNENVKIQTHLFTFLPGTELERQYRGELTRSSIVNSISGDIGVHDCEELIYAHPLLFPQYFEYRTPLRDRLKYFSRFMDAFILFLPVYRYLARRYAEAGLMQMYTDWVEKNADMLASCGDRSDIIHTQDMFLQDDAFLESFADDSRYPLLNDLARYIRKEHMGVLQSAEKKENYTEVYSFRVDEYAKGRAVEEYRTGVSVMNTVYLPDGSKKTYLKIL